MNLSSSAARASSGPAPGAGAELAALPFPYDELPPGGGIKSEPAFAPVTTQTSSADQAQARQLGHEEGRAEARKNFEQKLTEERGTIAAALTQFARDRVAYYARLEREVVQLALAIARKILHREAQVDPLLLAGIVRVALEKIEGATAVTLRVHPQVAADWRRYLASRMEPENLPTIVEDPALEPERCVLETSMGTAQLGVELQLKEIEQGFMDLLAARPQENA